MAEEQHEPQRGTKQAGAANRMSPRDGSQEGNGNVDYPRKRASVACEVCRLRKTRCDAKQPTCSFCAQSGATCEYRRTVIPTRVATEIETEYSNTTHDQGIIDRLARIENLLEDLRFAHSNNIFISQRPDSGGDVMSLSPPSRELSTTLERRPSLNSDLFVGHSLKGLSRLIGQATPEALIPLTEEDGEAFLELEVNQGEALFDTASAAKLQTLDLNSSTCWRLQQSFTRSILHWCPFIDQEECARLVYRTCDLQFPDDNLDTCLTLFVLALGAVAKNNYRGDTGAEFGGLDYFQVAANMVARPNLTIYSITAVQCRLLEAFYFLYCLRPVQAFSAVHQASLAVLSLLQLKSQIEKDIRFRQQLYRAYWACYFTEHELQSVVSYSSCLLQLKHEFVPLPLFDHDEPGSYWFLSEIAARKIFTNSREGFAWNSNSFFTVHRTAVVHEIILQLQQWYDYLPTQIKFPLNTAPLIDPHKVFLRAQYYAWIGGLYWSFVVRFLTSPPHDERERTKLLEMSFKCFDHCVMHVYAVESLFQERHLLLSANIGGLNCVANILICTYKLPALASIQHPKQKETIRKARNLLAHWATNPGVANHVSRLESLMMAKGLIVTGSDISCSPQPSFGTYARDHD